MKKFLSDKRNVVLALFVVLLLLAAARGSPRFVFWTAGGVLLTAGFDALAGIFLRKRRTFPKSALISGFIIAGVLDYRQPVFALAGLALAAILSKHLIRYRKLHVFNPANFALFLAAVLRMPLTWTLEANVYLIAAVGLYLAFTLKKLSHVLGFLVCFSVPLAAAERINPLGLVSWFFVFIMLIEPKTSGFGRRRGFVFGGIAGISAFLIFRFFPGRDFFVTALFIANLFNPLLAKIKDAA